MSMQALVAQILFPPSFYLHLGKWFAIVCSENSSYLEYSKGVENNTPLNIFCGYTKKISKFYRGAVRTHAAGFLSDMSIACCTLALSPTRGAYIKYSQAALKGMHCMLSLELCTWMLPLKPWQTESWQYREGREPSLAYYEQAMALASIRNKH